MEMLNVGRTHEMLEDLAARFTAEQALSGKERKARAILRYEMGSMLGGRSPDARIRSSDEQNSGCELLG
ncbi:hypothetical protein JET14_17520 [Martelella lutilitoris]|uniref:Uncharacterized protein n=1 Tax=Martelella lutilitoris TaxID=2583532 RepID=A0A7T7KLN6_9HYPH|nr:hypothetical protein [Martelella lutilitoris]QQM30064.1 hypothetical protein JET14_17520 [Martelella lutilitoris]